MEFNAKKIDSANAVITSTITKEEIEKNLAKVAKDAAKNLKVDGFRKGKVPANVIKARYGQKLEEDATSEALRVLFTQGLKELGISDEALIGEPNITKFDKKEDGSIDVEVKLACRPTIDLGDYKALIPEVKAQEVSAEEVDKRMQDMAASSAPIEKLKRKRAARENDYAVIDFEGFVGGVAFDGGKAEQYTLQLGSNSFIPGFEDQVIGMKYEEQKDIVVTFPTEYQAKDLAGKEATFKVTLHELKEKGEAVIDDEFAKKVLPNEENATVDSLKEKIKEQVANEKRGVYYREELKPAYLDILVEKLDFALPATVVEQEVNMALNAKVRTMSEEEIKALQEDESKVDALREEFKEDASKSVKATFIVDALAKAEGISVSDQEVSQILYYEAMQMGQNPQDVLKQYQDAGYLPAIKMSMIEDKVITKLLDEKSGK
ncbi:MAG: trigger factor [Arcobacteraceae bacterium]